MPKAEYENNKFIVVNRKHLEKIDNRLVVAFYHLLDAVNYENKNNYYVCNQDEPYAQKVIDTILKGESEKA